MYTKVLSIGVIFILLTPSVFADKSKQITTQKGVQTYDFGIGAEFNNGSVIVNWTPFRDRENFKWYKLAYSTQNPRPVYRQDADQFIGDNVHTSRYIFWPNTDDFVYINICAVTNDDVVFCDWGRKVMLGRHFQTDVKNNPVDTKQVEAKDIKLESEKKLDVKKDTQDYKNTDNIKKETQEVKNNISIQPVVFQVQQARLSPALQKRADEIIDSFILRMDNSGHSLDVIIANVELVQSRLRRLAVQMRYRQLSLYMIQRLELYKEEIDNGISEIEAIFRLF